MRLDYESTTPIYMQIATWLETEILKGNFKVDEKVFSQYKLAEMLHINPATAAKGLTLLGQENILYDKRGLGKFVSRDAKQLIEAKRKDTVLQELVEKTVEEATNLGISKDELFKQIDQQFFKKGRELKDDNM